MTKQHSSNDTNAYLIAHSNSDTLEIMELNADAAIIGSKTVLYQLKLFDEKNIIKKSKHEITLVCLEDIVRLDIPTGATSRRRIRYDGNVQCCGGNLLYIMPRSICILDSKNRFIRDIDVNNVKTIISLNDNSFVYAEEDSMVVFTLTLGITHKIPIAKKERLKGISLCNDANSSLIIYSSKRQYKLGEKSYSVHKLSESLNPRSLDDYRIKSNCAECIEVGHVYLCAKNGKLYVHDTSTNRDSKPVTTVKDCYSYEFHRVSRDGVLMLRKSLFQRNICKTTILLAKVAGMKVTVNRLYDINAYCIAMAIKYYTEPLLWEPQEIVPLRIVAGFSDVDIN
jgi:hypothetical protein